MSSKVNLADSIHTTRGDKVFFALNYTFMIFLALITLYPMLYVLFCSLSDPNDFALVRGIMLRPAGFRSKDMKWCLR